MIYLDGAYRVHRSDDAARFTKLAAEAFPEFSGRITCFGADWLGRQFANDRGRLIGGAPQVLMLEPGTGQALEIPVDQAAFHEVELVQEPEAAVAYSFFHDWKASGGVTPSYEECVGYQRPLYLGGTDDLRNLQLTGLDVYWTLSAQMLARIRGLPVGTRIADVTIS
jgi:hypothetical protein